MIKLFYFLYFNLFPPKESSKVRLAKKEDKSSFDGLCQRACPYIILACLIILVITLFIALVHYGHCFSTEANNWYYNSKV